MKPNTLPQNSVPGQGRRLADKAAAEGGLINFWWRPEFCDGKIIGFLVAFEGQTPRLVR